MATKLDRKTLPSGYSASDFTYQGRPADDQHDFGVDVGLVDAACVDQFGDVDSSKYYHMGVVQATDNTWWCYFEWGRISGGKSWGPTPKRNMSFQFVQCMDESDARTALAKQCAEKNTKRIEQNRLGLWVSKLDKKGKSKSGYIVQSLAMRERGLPDAYGIKDASGVTPSTPARSAAPVSKPTITRAFHPEVIALAKSLVGGTQDYARAAQQATGIVPTMKAIEQVRDKLITEALKRLAVVGDDIDRQVADQDLIDISKVVASLVPRVIPLGVKSKTDRARAAILSSTNILALQADLDAYEAALKSEDWSVKPSQVGFDPSKALNAELEYVDLNSALGREVAARYQGLTNNRHSYIRGKAKIHNIFKVSRPDRDVAFLASVKRVAASRQGRVNAYAQLQPGRRSDLSDVSDYAAQANIFVGIHGTRAVNVAPILQGNLRLPRQLKGVHITGAAFGHGIYFATDYKKSYGYTGYSRSYYGAGGNISGRKAFMFLHDVIAGNPYMCNSTGSWGTSPKGTDSVFAAPPPVGKVSSLSNDEHIIFDPTYQRIRYVVEMSM